MNINFFFKFSLILMILVSIQALSQNNNKALDERNGFKNFTFGDLKSTYSDFLIKDNSTTASVSRSMGGVDYFVYTKAEPYELFGNKWESVSLGFTRNQLTNINVKWRYNERVFAAIINDLEEVFGKAEKSENKFTVTYIWRGEDIIMSIKGMSSAYPEDYGYWDFFELKIEDRGLANYIKYNKKKDF